MECALEFVAVAASIVGSGHHHQRAGCCNHNNTTMCNHDCNPCDDYEEAEAMVQSDSIGGRAYWFSAHTRTSPELLSQRVVGYTEVRTAAEHV